MATLPPVPDVRNSTLGYVKDFVYALLARAVLFGLPLSEQQMAGILLVFTSGGVLLLNLNVRRQRK